MSVATLALFALLAGAPSVVQDDGYLTTAERERLVAATAPAPSPGSSEALADREASERWRAFEDTDRWMLATRHVEVRPPLALQHFDCALGVRLGSVETPALTAMMLRAFADANAVSEMAKARGHRARPVGDDPDRRACQRVDAAGRASAGHPSGSAAVATTQAELFATLEPDRAEAVRAVGRQIGVSRLVCAMHYDSDVRAGADLGRETAAVITASPAFQGQAAEARAELAAARATGLTSPACAAEARALAMTP